MLTELPGFTDLVLVGQGGEAQVYRAYESRLERVVAIKLVKGSPELSVEAANTAMHGVTHPNIVTVLGTGVTPGGDVYIVTPFYPGGSLEDRLARDGSMDIEAVLRIGVKLSGALAAIHDADLVHCDVKPGNVLLDSFGEVILSDFGIARRMVDSMTRSGFTLPYAAREVLDGKIPGPPADVYGLAVTLATLLRGRRPQLSEIWHPEALLAEVPEVIRTILDDATCPDPEKRIDARSLGMGLQQAQLSLGLPMTEMLADPTEDLNPTALLAAISDKPGGMFSDSPNYEQDAAGENRRGEEMRRSLPFPVPAAPSSRISPRARRSRILARRQRPWPGRFREIRSRLGRWRASIIGMILNFPPIATFRSRVKDRASVRQGNIPSSRAPLGIMTPDRPTTDDLLGYRPLIVGLGRLLDDPGTALPLTIGINGPWGAGKSSVMLQLARYLTGDRRGDFGAPSRQWCTVSFDAWRFQGREAIWVGLARCIYEQCQGETATARLAFRVRLELRRRGWMRSVAAVAVLFAGLVLGSSLALDRLAGTGDVLVSTGYAAGALSAVVVAIAYLGVVGEPFARALTRNARVRTFEDFLGISHAAERDISCLFETITRRRGRHGVIVLLDDLDRCSPGTILETLTTISEVFAKSSDRPIVFVLGVDLDIVASAVGSSFTDISTELSSVDARRATRLGDQYLEKIFQLSVGISSRGRRPLDYLLFAAPQESVSESSDHASGYRDPWTVDPDLVSSWAARLVAKSPENPSEATFSGFIVDNQFTTLQNKARRRAARDVRASLLSVGSEDVRNAEIAATRPLSLTPRAIKRFDNAYRLQLQVANGTPGSELRYTGADLTGLAKWVALCMFFPRLVRVIDGDPGLLGELETMADEVDMLNLTRRVSQLLPDSPAELVAEAAALLRAGMPDARIARLPLHTFMNTA